MDAEPLVTLSTARIARSKAISARTESRGDSIEAMCPSTAGLQDRFFHRCIRSNIQVSPDQERERVRSKIAPSSEALLVAQ